MKKNILAGLMVNVFLASSIIWFGYQKIPHKIKVHTIKNPATNYNVPTITNKEKFLKDFQSIKIGMTRGEIENKFKMDGGIQCVSHVRFIHPECPYLKINVSFEFKKDKNDQNRPIWSPEDKVTDVSKPYIENPYLD